MKIFKSEIYKLLISKTLYILLFFIFTYSLLVNIIYYFNKLDIILLFQNFNEEFFLLYLVLSIYISSSIITDEFNYDTIIDLYNKKIIIPKLLSCFFYLFIIFLFSLLFCYDISLIYFKNMLINPKLLFSILKGFGMMLPYLSIVILISINLSLIIKKQNLTLIIIYIIYFISEYVNNFILKHHYYNLYYFLSINFNFNKNYLIKNIVPLYYSILFCTIIILILILFAIAIFKYLKK